MYFVPVEECFDIAFLKLVELRWQWFCDSGICQLLFAAWGEVVYLSYSFFDELAEIGCLGSVDNRMVETIVIYTMDEITYLSHASLD